MSAMGIGLIIFIIFFVIVGIGMVFFVRGSGKRYIVCGKSLPFFFVGTMLMAQAIDANGSIGAASMAYSYGFWAGFAFPLGVAICLVITAFVFAKPLNRMNLLTLPDFFFRRYDSKTEFTVSILMCISFVILVAGNFSGSAWILTVVYDMDYLWALILISTLIFVYTVFGGLFSCAATDIVQIYPAMAGFVGCAIYLVYHNGWAFFNEAIPPDFLGFAGLTQLDNGALATWGAIVAVGVGDVVALDFMERVFAARDPRTAQIGCLYASVFTLVMGVSCAVIGLMGLKLYLSIADPRMVMPLIAMEHMPFILGLLMVAGVIGAGASTANGGILGVATVMGRNMVQKNILRWIREAKGEKLMVEHTEEARRKFDAKLLLISRIMAIPVLIMGIWVGYVKPEPGMLLALAFDVVLAGCFMPLLLGVHWKKANTPGAMAGIISGSLLRLYLHFTIPEHLIGLETIIAPLVSLVFTVAFSLMTQKTHAPKHHVVNEVPDDADVLAGIC